MPAPTCSITLRLMPSRSSRLMPGLRGTPAVTMQTSAPSMRLVGIGAGELGVEAVDRRGLREVERLALRHALGDVEHHDVAEFFQADQMGQRAADLTRADQRNLVARHVEMSLMQKMESGKPQALVKPFGRAVQVNLGRRCRKSFRALEARSGFDEPGAARRWRRNRCRPCGSAR